MKDFFLNIRDAFISGNANYIFENKDVVFQIYSTIKEKEYGTKSCYKTQLGFEKSSIFEYDDGYRLILDIWNKKTEYSFYPHSHKYNFYSLVLNGSIKYNVFKKSESGNRYSIYKCYSSQKMVRYVYAGSDSFQCAKVVELNHNVVCQVPYDEFHTVDASPDARSLILRSRPKRQYSEVISPSILPKELPVIVL